jgi:hypothetical protein
MTPVGTDNKAGADFKWTLRLYCADARHDAVFFNEPRHLGLHDKAKRRIKLRLLFPEVERVPLRHQRQKLAVRRNTPEIPNDHGTAPTWPASSRSSWCGCLRNSSRKPSSWTMSSVDGWNRVAAKVTQKIGMLFKNNDCDAHPRQQEAQHHPGRAAARNATDCFQRLGIALVIVHAFFIMRGRSRSSLQPVAIRTSGPVRKASAKWPYLRRSRNQPATR